MNPCELSASITATANVMAATLSEEELAIAAVVFTQLGDTLATLAATRAICTKKGNASSK